MSVPALTFATPRKLPSPGKLTGRVVVLDVAFAANISASVSYEAITKPFLAKLGARLAAWVDHHDHERHVDYADDDRFVLATKAAHGACPEMITPALVSRIGPVDTIMCHVDLDGLYAAAKWILGGQEPYAGADADAYAVDTRLGVPSAIAMTIDNALRARFRDDELKRSVVHFLIGGQAAGVHRDRIDEASAEFAARAAGTAQLAARYVVRGRVAYLDATSKSAVAYDKTDLLLAGQTMAPVAMVRDSGQLAIAAAFASGWDFVSLLGLAGGMPTRISIPDQRLTEALEKINSAPLPTPRSAAATPEADET
ncbi:MAG: hypothetical protein IPL79_03295 [Myxococcales bacterium]|nr:hypothetical protein [Myxococcales bacterium]